MKKEDAFEKALRQVVQKRNEQSPVLSEDFAQRVKVQMESRRRNLSFGRWAAVVGVAASLALLFVLNLGRGHQASGGGEPLVAARPVEQNVSGVPAFVPYPPLFIEVKHLEIGVEEDRKPQFLPVSREQPVVFYGTSIAHGNCASRSDLTVVPSLATASPPPARPVIKRKVKPKEPRLPDVPELTPEQLQRMQLELENAEQEMLAREQAQENALLEYARELEQKKKQLLREEAALEKKLKRILLNL